MGLTTAIILYATSSACLGAANSGNVSQKPDSEVERLIDALQEVQGQETSYYLGISTNNGLFLPLLHEPSPIAQYQWAYWSESPANPSLKKLVELGLRALPSLIEHLSDSRETKLVVEKGIWGLLFSKRYEPRFKDPARRPPGTLPMYETRNSEKLQEPYVIRVGDLCLVAIGHIVNRQNSILGGHAGDSPTWIMSPVNAPAIAEAVKSDWGQLTPAQHREQLTYDAADPLYLMAPDAVERLLYYYPVEGERLAIKMLGRDYYDDVDVWTHLDDALDGAETVSEWSRLHKEGVKRFSKAVVETIPFHLYDRFADRWSNADDKQRELAKEVLAKLFPEYTPYHHKPFSVVSLDDQFILIVRLRSFISDKLDNAVQDAFRRSLKFAGDKYVDRVRDRLAIACLERMTGKGHDSEYKEYLTKRIPELESELDDDEDHFVLTELKRWNRILK